MKIALQRDRPVRLRYDWTERTSACQGRLCLQTTVWPNRVDCFSLQNMNRAQVEERNVTV
jgi:hypothetical protein